MQEDRRFEPGHLHQLFPGLPLETIGHSLGGLVAAEGSFCIKDRGKQFVADGSPRLCFAFQVTMATRDRPLLDALQQFLSAGVIYDDPPPKAKHWLPRATFSIVAEQTHLAVTIPFAERFLLPSAKRRQFEEWRDRLTEYRRTRPSQYGRGPSTCSIESCDRPVRGRGLCRSHYYCATGY